MQKINAEVSILFQRTLHNSRTIIWSQASCLIGSSMHQLSKSVLQTLKVVSISGALGSPTPMVVMGNVQIVLYTFFCLFMYSVNAFLIFLNLGNFRFNALSFCSSPQTRIQLDFESCIEWLSRKWFRIHQSSTGKMPDCKMTFESLSQGMNFVLNSSHLIITS